MNGMGVPFLVLAAIAAVFALALWYARRSSRRPRRLPDRQPLRSSASQKTEHAEPRRQEVRTARDVGSVKSGDAILPNRLERAAAPVAAKQPVQRPAAVAAPSPVAAPAPVAAAPAAGVIAPATAGEEWPDTVPSGWTELAGETEPLPAQALTVSPAGEAGPAGLSSPATPVAAEPGAEPGAFQPDGQSSAPQPPSASAAPIQPAEPASPAEDNPGALQFEAPDEPADGPDELPPQEAAQPALEAERAGEPLSEIAATPPPGAFAQPPQFEAEAVTTAAESDGRLAVQPIEEPCRDVPAIQDPDPLPVTGNAQAAPDAETEERTPEATTIGADPAGLAGDPYSTQEEQAAAHDPQLRAAEEPTAAADASHEEAVTAAAEAESPSTEDSGAEVLEDVPDTGMPGAGEAGMGDEAASPQSEVTAAAANVRRPVRPAVHRDRRGRQVTAQPPATDTKRPRRQASNRPPAEARLRLTLHPIRRTVQLALVLMKPEDFPSQVTLELGGSPVAEALGDGQYGDIDLPWDQDLLASEIRVSSAEGFQWVRSARPVHIFAADPAQAGLVTVASAAAGAEHTIVCREQDASAICDIAESAGSVRPAALQRFTGAAAGWVVLTGYRPARAAALTPSQEFLPLDPGHAIEITLQGGLEIGRRTYAQGRPPRIRIEPMLDGVSVRIGGVEAADCGDGSWEAPGWDSPGPHLIDVVPGPTLKYEVLEDPATAGGWSFWDAHAGRTAAKEGPWSEAGICGALLAGPAAARVMAAETQPSILALGVDGKAAVLRQRPSAGVSVGFASGTPAFLLVSSGRRRSQGKVVWLGVAEAAAEVLQKRQASPLWVDAVRSAAARRLAMHKDEAGAGQSIWRKAVLLARSIKRQRHE